MTNKPVFKNNSGVHYIKALFYEVALEDDRKYVLYTMKNYDHEGYPSIQRLFLEMNDPTEYTFATKYFDSWRHWKLVREAVWFKPIYNEMVEELHLRIKAKALFKIREAAENSDKDKMQANRYLLEGGYIDKEDKRGRPSKAKVKEEADKIVRDHEQINDDYGRILSIADRQ